MIKTSAAPTFALSILVSGGMLAGCSGSQSPLTPSGAISAVRSPGALPFVMPDAARHETLAYIGDFDGSGIQEFHFPKGEPLHHPLSGSDEPQGMCSRTDRGDFWVTNSGSETLNEYEAGRTKVLKTLSVAPYGDPAGCAVSHTGDVVASLITGGDVVVFPHGTGSGTEYSDALEETFFDTYDSSGDLFVDGFNSEVIPAVSEMPAGSSTFHPITLPNTIGFPGIVQWDGTYIAVVDQEVNAIYRYSVSGSTATLEGTVELSDASDCGGGYIFKGKYFLCADAGDNNVKVYAYPAGGAPIDTWKGSGAPVDAIVIEK
jgi:hypothetical protein